MHQAVWIEVEATKVLPLPDGSSIPGKTGQQGRHCRGSKEDQSSNRLANTKVSGRCRIIPRLVINYHRHHIKDFAEIASCLYELTGPKSHFKWTPAHQEVFEKL